MQRNDTILRKKGDGIYYCFNEKPISRLTFHDTLAQNGIATRFYFPNRHCIHIFYSNTKITKKQNAVNN